jgi:hypothetical protein
MTDHPHPPGSYFAHPDVRAYIDDKRAAGYTVVETPGCVAYHAPPRPPSHAPAYGWWSLGWDCLKGAAHEYTAPNPQL